MSQGELWVVGSPRTMRVGEAIAFPVDTAPYGSGTLSNLGAVAYDAAGADVSNATLTGNPTADGSVITLPVFSPTALGKYRIIFSFTNNRFALAKPALDVHVVP